MKPTELSRALELLATKRRSCFIWGPPGIGKSDIVAQVAKRTERDLRDVRLALMDPVDIKGFPVPNHETHQMSWLPPDFLPAMTVKREVKVSAKKTETQTVPNDSRGILFLDEFNTAERATQAAAYQLLLNHRIGEYVLPEGWSIVAAGNRQGDRAIANTMSSANASRLVHLDLEVNLEDWSAWALKNGIKPEILAFLRTSVTSLHTFDPDKQMRTFACPRTWMFVNDIIGEGLPKNEEFEVIKGTIDEGTASAFVAYLQHFRDLPSIDQIRLNPDSAPVPKNPSALYALTTSLGMVATPANYGALMKYVDRIPTEFQVVFVRDSAARNDENSQTPEFTKWAIDHADVLM